jgi:hypothetical protein
MGGKNNRIFFAVFWKDSKNKILKISPGAALQKNNLC